MERQRPEELSWQAIQSIVGVKLAVELLRFDDIGFHLIKSHTAPVHTTVNEPDSDIEIVEEGEGDSEVEGGSYSQNGLSGASEDSAIAGESGEDTWACPNCNLRFFSKDDWTKHMESPCCDDNDNSIDNNLSIDEYLEVTLSTESDTFPCNKCQKTFPNERDLAAHSCSLKTKSEKITEPRKHGCHVCAEKFNSYLELRKHINAHFPGMLDSKSSYCHICQKDYTKTGFMNHLRKHTGERPFVCELCHKAFSQSSSLSIHMKFHLNVRKHCCSVCEKKFVTKSELSRHMTVHTKQKSYYCGVCDKAFTRSDNMKKHEKTHG